MAPAEAWREADVSTRFGSRIVFQFGWVGKLSVDRARDVAPPHHRMPTRALGTICAIAQTCVLAITVSPAAAQGWNEVRYHRWDQVQYKARTKPKSAETEHASKEPFGTIPKGPVQIIISIDQQQLHLYSDGTQVANALVATGVPAHPTPAGVFSVIQKSLLHHSNIYSGAPMPYMQRITWSGVALHEGGNLGHPASHGCARMPHDFATA